MPDIAAVTIRPIQPSDNPALARIIRDALTEFGANKPGTVYYDPTTDNLYELFTREGSFYLVAEKDGILFGGAGLYPSDGLPDKTCELVKMYLRKDSRGQGLGRMLIARCIEQAKSLGYKAVYLETMPELKKAVTVYEQFGFKYLNAPMGNTGHFGCDVWMFKQLD